MTGPSAADLQFGLHITDRLRQQTEAGALIWRAGQGGDRFVCELEGFRVQIGARRLIILDGEGWPILNLAELLVSADPLCLEPLLALLEDINRAARLHDSHRGGSLHQKLAPTDELALTRLAERLAPLAPERVAPPSPTPWRRATAAFERLSQTLYASVMPPGIAEAVE